MNEVQNYNDIINLPHHVSKVHPPMSMDDRAAQFAPFAALTGHEEAIKETARITDTRIELDEDAKERLNEKLHIICDNVGMGVPVKITYFVPDEKKTGGEYVTCVEAVKKVDEYKSVVIMSDDTVISISQIINIERDIESECWMIIPLEKNEI